jgi:spore germination protein GerM
VARTSTSALAALALALAVGACNPAESQAPSSAATPPSTSTPTVVPTNTASDAVRVYFFVGSLVENGGLVPVERAVSPQEPGGSVERAALEALLAGPTEAELAASPAMYSVMPEGTRVLGLELGSGGAATVDLSSEFEAAGSANAKGRLAQVVFTLTQFPAITDVHFKIAGTPIMAFTDAQLPLEPPVDRTDYTDQLPVIFLDTPAWGARLGNPAHLTGLSDAFEAQFLVRILDAGGHAVAERSVMASCGSGCWGTFDESIPYPATVSGSGRVQAYELSEVDGSIVSLTDYPVTLGP